MTTDKKKKKKRGGQEGERIGHRSETSVMEPSDEQHYQITRINYSRIFEAFR